MVPKDLVEAIAELPARGMCGDVHWHDSVPSTMDRAAALADAGAPHGSVVGAEEQTAGRGRRGNTWASPAGAGLYFSFVARPYVGFRLSLLTLAAGLGVRAGISAATGLAPDLKWPNDLMVGRRKLAGILAEGIAIGTADQAVIVGVGINVLAASYSPDVSARATSISSELSRDVDRGVLFREVLSGLWSHLCEVGEKPGDILRAWLAASPSATGTRVEWDMKHGTTAGIDEAGALLVRTSNGIERIIAGELHWHL